MEMGYITMGFVAGQPRTKGHKGAIWVIMDRLTQTAHFVPINMTYPLEKLAQFYENK